MEATRVSRKATTSYRRNSFFSSEPSPGKLSSDGRKYTAKFNRSDLRKALPAAASSEVRFDLMITGSLRHNGLNSLFATSATVKVHGSSDDDDDDDDDD